MSVAVLGKKLPRIAAAILLAGAAGACSTAQDIEPVYEVNGQRQPTNKEDLHKSGIEHLKAGRFGLALQDLRKALQQDPDSVSTLNAIAIGYDELQRFDLSRRYYIKSLALDPDSVQTLNNMGNSLLRQRKVKEALAYFEKARTIGDRNETVRANLESAKSRLGRIAAVTDAKEEPVADAEVETESSSTGIPEERTHVASTTPVWIERTSSNVQTLVTRVEPQGEASSERSDVHPSDVSFRNFDMPIGPEPRERPSVTSPMVMSKSSWGPPLLLETSRVDREAARLFHEMFLEMGSDAPVHVGGAQNDIPMTLSAPEELGESAPVRIAALAMAPVLSDGSATIERAIRTRKIETHLGTPEPIENLTGTIRVDDRTQKVIDTDGNDIHVPDLADVQYVEPVPGVGVHVRYPTVEVSALGEPSQTIDMLVDTVAGDVYRRVDRAIVSDLPVTAPVSKVAHAPETLSKPVTDTMNDESTSVFVDDGLAEVSASAVEPVKGPRPVTRVASLGFTEVDNDVSASAHRPAHSPMVGIGSFTLEVSNGAGRRHMAARLGEHLEEHGFSEAILTNAVSFNFTRSIIFYRPGFELAAGEVASTLPFQIDMQEYENKYADIRLRLGGDLLAFDKSLLTAMKGQ